MSSASRPSRSLGAVDRLDRRCPPGTSTPRRRSPPRRRTRAAVAERQAREALRDAHASFSLVRVRKSSASTPIAQESSTLSRRGLPGDDHPAWRRPRAARRPRLGAPLGVRRVGAGEADDRLAVVRRQQLVGVRRSGRRRRPRCRRRRAGWWRRSRGRCAAATVPSVARKTGAARGLVAQRLEAGAVAADRRRAVASAGRSGSVSARFGNSVSPVIGRLRRAISASRLATVAAMASSRRLAVLDPAEDLPAGAGQVVGELLDGVGAAGRVGDPGDVRLGDQQAGGVAGDPAAEGVRARRAGCRTAAR